MLSTENSSRLVFTESSKMAFLMQRKAHVVITVLYQIGAKQCSKPLA